MQTTKPNEPHFGVQLLYILKDALKEYQTKEQTYGESNLPPGIQEEISQDGASVRLLLDVSVAGRGGSRTRPGVYNIFNEKITVKVVQPATTAEGKKEVLALFATGGPDMAHVLPHAVTVFVCSVPLSTRY